jgi:hypothetical protein
MAERQVAETMLVIQEGTQFIAMSLDGQVRLWEIIGTNVIPMGPDTAEQRQEELRKKYPQLGRDKPIIENDPKPPLGDILPPEESP